MKIIGKNSDHRFCEYLELQNGIDMLSVFSEGQDFGMRKTKTKTTIYNCQQNIMYIGIFMVNVTKRIGISVMAINTEVKIYSKGNGILKWFFFLRFIPLDSCLAFRSVCKIARSPFSWTQIVFYMRCGYY